MPHVGVIVRIRKHRCADSNCIFTVHCQRGWCAPVLEKLAVNGRTWISMVMCENGLPSSGCDCTDMPSLSPSHTACQSRWEKLCKPFHTSSVTDAALAVCMQFHEERKKKNHDTQQLSLKFRLNNSHVMKRT